MKSRDDLKKTTCCIIKIGSAVLTDNGRGLNHSAIDHWVEQISQLKKQGVDVVVVSSGSVAEGMVRLGWSKRPHELNKLQAAASIGQMGLIQAYEQSFQRHGSQTAQVLLTHDDLSNRTRHLNARSTIKTLLDLSVVPIINENDAIANEELKVGDNDTLAAMIANLLSADLLMILTDQDGLFDSDPRSNANAELISEANVDDARLDGAAGGSAGLLGRGGMLTKLKAARIAARSGAATLIVPGLTKNVVLDAFEGGQIGTLLVANEAPMSARKRWLSTHLKIKGWLTLDDGAVKSMSGSGVSLLSVGVTGVNGEFERGDLVVCEDQQGREVARGLVNYSSEQTDKIKQKNSNDIEEVLGFVEEPELINRDNLIVQ